MRIASKKSNSEVSSQTLKGRARCAMDILTITSGGSNDDETQKQLLVTEMMRKNTALLRAAAEKAGIFSQGKISVEDAINIKALAHLSMNKVRDMH